MALTRIGTSAYSTLDATKLAGNLPSISGASLTSLTAGNLTGTLPAISGANLTNLPAHFIRTGNFSGTTAGMDNCFSSSYKSYVILMQVINTGTDNTFLNMRFKSSSGVNSSNLNNSFIYSIGSGSTSVSCISQDTVSSNTHRLSVGDDINETYIYQINITNVQGNNIFFSWTAGTEDWVNGKSQNIKGSGKHYSDGTNILGIDFVTNAGTSVSGEGSCYAIKYD